MGFAQKLIGFILFGVVVLFFLSQQLESFSLNTPLPSKTDPKDSALIQQARKQELDLTPSQSWTSDEGHEELQKQLEKTLSLHTRFLEKCYIRLLDQASGQVDPGTVLVQVQITAKGQMKDPVILDSPYQSSPFHECVSEVLSRVKIKFYQGGPRKTQIPLDFKTP